MTFLSFFLSFFGRFWLRHFPMNLLPQVLSGVGGHFAEHHLSIWCHENWMVLMFSISWTWWPRPLMFPKDREGSLSCFSQALSGKGVVYLCCFLPRARECMLCTWQQGRSDQLLIVAFGLLIVLDWFRHSCKAAKGKLDDMWVDIWYTNTLTSDMHIMMYKSCWNAHVLHHAMVDLWPLPLGSRAQSTIWWHFFWQLSTATHPEQRKAEGSELVLPIRVVRLRSLVDHAD